MSEIEELYENFPTILKEKLRNKEIEFPSNTKFDYEKIYVYRAVSREITDFHEIDKNDFRSYFELGKKPKKLVKGRSLKNDAHWYGVSTFTNKEIIEFFLNFRTLIKKWLLVMCIVKADPKKLRMNMSVGGCIKM